MPYFLVPRHQRPVFSLRPSEGILLGSSVLGTVTGTGEELGQGAENGFTWFRVALSMGLMGLIGLFLGDG